MGAQSFNGIGVTEARNRVHQVQKIGVARAGNPSVPISWRGTLNLISGIRLQVTGSPEDGSVSKVFARGVVKGATKTVTARYISSLQTGTKHVGWLGATDIVPGSLTITDGALASVTDTDNGDGTGALANGALASGTIVYATGMIDLDWGAAITKPNKATFQHTGFSDLIGATQTLGSLGAAGPVAALSFTATSPIVPGTLSITDGVDSAVDDGIGNVIQTGVGGDGTVIGAVNYTTGAVTATLVGGPTWAAGGTTATWKIPNHSWILAGGGGQQFQEFFPDSSTTKADLTQDGLKGSTSYGIKAETNHANGEANLSVELQVFGDGAELEVDIDNPMTNVLTGVQAGGSY